MNPIPMTGHKARPSWPRLWYSSSWSVWFRSIKQHRCACPALTE